MGDAADLACEAGESYYLMHLNGECDTFEECQYCRDEEKQVMPINIAEGVVERFAQRQANTQYGEKTAYSVKLDDGEWYSLGFKKPTYGEGSKIQFTYTMNGKYRNGDDKNLEVLEHAEPAVATETDKPVASTQPASTGGGLTRDQFWANKEERDIDTSIRLDIIGARNSAIEFVSKAVELGALTLGAANAKKEVKYDLFLAAVEKQAQEWYLHPENMIAQQPQQEDVPASEED